jgi:hypothetical protein
MTVDERLRDAMNARANQLRPDVEDALRHQLSLHQTDRPAVRRPLVAILATAAAVVVVAAAIPVGLHVLRARHGHGSAPVSVPTAAGLPSTTPSVIKTPSASSTPTPSASTSATAAGAGAAGRLFIQDLEGTGATFYLDHMRVETVNGTPIGTYSVAAKPPAGAFDVSTDGLRLAYLAPDGVHIANASDGTADHVVHALPHDASRPDPAINATGAPFANWARGGQISWSTDGSSLAVVWQGCLWTMASDGSSLTEVARNSTSTPVEGAGGVVSVTWSPSSNELLVSVYGSATILATATRPPFSSDPSTGSGEAAAVVAADRQSYRPLAGQAGAWSWAPDGSRVIGWNVAGTALVTVAPDGAEHTIAQLPAPTAYAVSPDGSRLAGIRSDGAIGIWPITGGSATAVPGFSAADPATAQLHWLDAQRLIVSTTSADHTTRLTAIDLTGSTQVLQELRTSTSSGYLVVDVRLSHP